MASLFLPYSPDKSFTPKFSVIIIITLEVLDMPDQAEY
jgi:hypothetical protein